MEIILPSKLKRPFRIAVQEGDLTRVESLLCAGVDVETPMQNQWTALALAASRNQYDLVDLLLSHGANPHFLDPFSRTILNLFIHHTRTPLDFRIAQRLVDKGVNPYGKLWMNENGGEESPLNVLLKKQKTPEIFDQWIAAFPVEKYIGAADGTMTSKKYIGLLLTAGLLWHKQELLLKVREECQKMGCLESDWLSADSRGELVGRCLYRDELLFFHDLQSANIIHSNTRYVIHRNSIAPPHRTEVSWVWMAIQYGSVNIFEEVFRDMKPQLQSEWHTQSVDLVSSLGRYTTCRQFEMLRQLDLDISMGDGKGNTLAHHYAASGLMGKTFVRWMFHHGLTKIFEQKNAEGITVWDMPYRYPSLKEASVKNAKMKALRAYAESIELRNALREPAQGVKKLPTKSGMRL